MRLLACAVVLTTSIIMVSTADLSTVYEWKYLDYVWESKAQKQKAVDSGEYDHKKLMPFDVDVAKGGRVFISMVGRAGVPAVLATVTNQTGPSGPLIRPYPNWSYFKKGSCDRIQNVYRTTIDKCNRLWALDAGFVHFGEPRTCPAQLLAFDLKTDRLIKRIKIPSHYGVGHNNDTLMVTPIVETRGSNCEDTTVFMADAAGFGMVIWNNGKLNRLENPRFHPSSKAVNVTSGKYTEVLDVGLVTMDLSPQLLPGEKRSLYFHSLASFDLYAANTDVLKRSTNGKTIKFEGAKNMLSSQAIGMAFSTKGTLFMGLTKESGVSCWNRYRPMKRENVHIVTQDNERLQYISGMKVHPTPSSKDEELWVVYNRLITFAVGKMNYNDTNFRILKSSVKKLIAGTKCQLPPEIRKKRKLCR